MFIRKAEYDRLVKDASDAKQSVAVLLGVGTELRRINSAQETTIDWFRVRISQLERERAQLLFNYTGVKVEAPSIERAPEADPSKNLQHVPNFEDIGDKEAGRLGIGWNPDGTLKTGSEV